MWSHHLMLFGTRRCAKEFMVCILSMRIFEMLMTLQSRSRPLFRSHTVKFEIWHIPIVDFYAIYHLFVCIITYKYTNISLTLYMIGLSTKSGVLWSFWKEIWKSAKRCEKMRNFGKIWCFRGTIHMYLMKEASFHLFKTISQQRSKIKLLYDE